MTDKIGALTALSRLPTPPREKALEFFYRAHCQEPLIIDKWFSLQATIPEPDTLARVKRLTKAHAFNIATPNRVYALIGAFANGNPLCFNAANGAGYGFVTDLALEIDRVNPQVAARLLSAFRSWRNLEPGRRRLAEDALRKVSEVANLSPDLRDIVHRALA